MQKPVSLLVHIRKCKACKQMRTCAVLTRLIGRIDAEVLLDSVLGNLKGFKNVSMFQRFKD